MELHQKFVNNTIKLFIPGGYGNIVTGRIPGAGTNVFDVGAFML